MLPVVPPEIVVHLFVAGETGVQAETDTNGFARLRRARPMFQARDEEHGLGMMVQAEFAGGQFQLLDAFADLRLTDDLHVFAGQQVVTVSRAWHVPLHLVPLGDRSLANNTFTPGRRLGVRGLWTVGPLDLQVGLFDPAAAVPARYPLTMVRVGVGSEGARPNVGVPGRLGESSGAAFGLGAVLQPLEVPGTNQVTVTVDALAHHRGFSVLAEGFLRRNADTQGAASLQVGQLLPPGWLEVSGRVALVEQQVFQRRTELGLSAYLRKTDFALRLIAWETGGYAEQGLKLYGQARI